MSRVGKRSIVLPDGVKVQITATTVIAEGPKGKLEQAVFPDFKVELKEKELIIKRPSDSKEILALHGTLRSLINNIVVGVSKGYTKELEIEGMGYRAQTEGNSLNMQLGFTHIINFPIPTGISIKTPKPTQIIIEGADKYKVGQIAAMIRNFYEPEPYKGKGVRYKGEYIRHKAGKTVT